MSGDIANLGCVTVLEWPINVLVALETFSLYPSSLHQ